MLNKYFYLFICISVGTLQAQSPDIVWQKTVGGSDIDRGIWVEAVSSGGYILGGQSASNISGEKTENNVGPTLTNDIWLLRLDGTGNILWQNTIGGTDDEQFTSILPTPDGGFITGCSSKSGISGDKTGPNEGSTDYWIMKLNAAGNIIWQRNFGTNEAEALTAINLTADGGYIIGGISGGDINGDKTDTARGDVDYWILKLDALGNEEWQKTIGGNKEDYLYAAFQTADGGYMVGGSSKSTPSGERTLDLVGTSDMWFLKLDADGNIEWQESIGSNAKDRMNAMFPAADGGYIIAGYSPGNIFADKTENSLGTDYWIVKIDADGDIIWQNTIGSSNLDLLNAAKPTADGGCIAVGSSNSNLFADKSEASYGEYDYWVVKVDGTGNVEWDKTLGGTANDEPFGVCITADGNYTVSGYSASGISGNKTEASRGSNDYWLVTLAPSSPAPLCGEAPIGLYADNLTPYTAKLHWNDDPDAVKYKVQYRKSTTPGWTNTNATANFKNLFSLEPGTNYEYRIKSNCGAGLLSGWSDIEMFATAPLRLGALTDLNNAVLYPNPVNNILHFNISDNLIINYTIFNALGVQVQGGVIGQGNDGIDVSKLPAGIYSIQLQDYPIASFVKL